MEQWRHRLLEAERKHFEAHAERIALVLARRMGVSPAPAAVAIPQQRSELVLAV